MLVTFSCPANANITMFGDVAVQLIKMMGHTGTVPSAILAKDVPVALAHLEAAVEATKQQPKPDESADEDKDEETYSVSVSDRALPLIDLLKAAVKNESNVMWTDNS